MFTATRHRRDADKAQRRAAANRRIGHEMAWWYFWGPKLAGLTAMLAVGAAGWWLWTRVDHDLIAGYGGGAGLVLLGVYLVWWLREHSTYGSPNRYRRYTGTSAMHFLGLAGALLTAGAITLWASGV